MDIKRNGNWYEFDITYLCGHKLNVLTKNHSDFERLTKEATENNCDDCLCKLSLKSEDENS